MRIPQHQVLGDKFNVGDTALISFDIKAIPMFIPQMGAHLLAHLAHFGLQRRGLARGGEHIATNGIKLRFQLRIAIHHPGTHQGLMFPGPGLVLLIIGEGVGRGDQHARRPGRTQAGIHLIQNAGRSPGAEQVHDALGEAQVELTPVDLALAVGHHVHRAVVEENQVQIGAVAQLPAAQLAVTHHRKAAPFAIGQMLRLAVTGHHLHPRLMDDRIDDCLRQPG